MRSLALAPVKERVLWQFQKRVEVALRTEIFPHYPCTQAITSEVSTTIAILSTLLPLLFTLKYES